MKIQIKENCTYFYNYDIEVLMAVSSILSYSNTPFFDETRIAALKDKYYFLFDTASLLAHNGFFSIIEFFIDADPFITLDVFENILIDMPHTKFIQTFFCLDEPIATCEEFYKTNKHRFNSFLGSLAFFNETTRLIKDLFAFAREIYFELEDVIKHIENDRDAASKYFVESLKNTEPLEFSQKLMGKVFRNRGPYKHFYFTHSLFTPNKKAIRYFGINQVFFYPLYGIAIKEDDVINNLKAMADSTRFKILLLLKEKKTMRGMDIAAEMGLTSPTISHHISELKNVGLVHEEQEKNTKYYSINTNRLAEIISTLDSILK